MHKKNYINNWNNIGYSDYVNHKFNKKKNNLKLIIYRIIKKTSLNQTILNFKSHNSLFILLFILLSPVLCTGEFSEFYLRSDLKTVNGIVKETNLLMVPADDDFRKKKYKFYLITGQAGSDATPNVLSAAKHNAFSNLLVEKGVKSIYSMSESTNTAQHDETILSYEGYIKSGYTVSNLGYIDSNSTYTVEIEVWFAPIAYPSEWTMYYFKKKLSDIARNVISVFK